MRAGAAHQLLRVLVRLAAIPTSGLIATLVTFSALHFLPGDPVARERQTPLQYQQGIHQLGLDLPLPAQYIRLMSRIVNGDLARFLQPEAVITGKIGLFAAMIAIGAGIGIGALAASRVNSPLDRAVVSLSLVVYSMPNFVWGFLLILLTTTVLYQLTGGLIFYDVGPCCQGAQVLMPAFALGAQYVGYVARHTRASLLDEVQTEYATTARAKGLTEAAVIRRHALRNALINVISVLGPVVTTLVTGSLVIELIFGAHGLGRQLIGAILSRNYDVAVGVMFYYVLLIGIANFTVDSLYPLLDPRIRA